MHLELQTHSTPPSAMCLTSSSQLRLETLVLTHLQTVTRPIQAFLHLSPVSLSSLSPTLLSISFSFFGHAHDELLDGCCLTDREPKVCKLMSQLNSVGHFSTFLSHKSVTVAYFVYVLPTAPKCVFRCGYNTVELSGTSFLVFSRI